MSNLIVVASEADLLERLADKTGYNGWQKERSLLKQLGVYEALAQEIPLDLHGLHLDFCSGMGDFAKAILQSRKALRPLLAAEANVEMIAATQENMSAAKIPFHIFRARNKTHCILDSSTPTRGEVYQRSWDSLEGHVLLLEGNIAHTSPALKELLNDEKLSSASMTFLGSCPKIAASRELRSSAFLRGTTMGQIANEQTAVNVFDLATQCVKPGGTFFIADRNVYAKGISEDEITKFTKEVEAPLYEPYWKYERSFPLTVNVDQLPSTQKIQQLNPHVQTKVVGTTYRRTKENPDSSWKQALAERMRKFYTSV